VVRCAERDGILEWLPENPIRDITTRDVFSARIVGGADKARALLVQMEADGELTGQRFPGAFFIPNARARL